MLLQEILKKSQNKTKTGLKNLVTQEGDSKEFLTRKINQTEDRISGLKDKIEYLDQIRKGHEIFF